MSSIAFLLLTYGDHVKAEEIKNYLSKGNIYVHPKNISDVHSYLKYYIISNNVKTEWGKCSIIEAELELLKESYKNRNNKWFILMSDKCYPLTDFTTLYNKITAINKSIFHVSGFFDIPELKNFFFYKSSQFWILIREDVEIILNTYEKYLKILNKYSQELKNYSACDELLFLTLLINENPDYDFYNTRCTYSRWVYLTKNQHPFSFNKITEFDKIDFEENNALFVRKIRDTFSLIPIKPKDNLIVLFFDKKVGDSNKNYKTKMNENNKIINKIKEYVSNKNADTIILYTDWINEELIKDLINECVLYNKIYYAIYKETYMIFKYLYQNYIKQWKHTELIPIYIM